MKLLSLLLTLVTGILFLVGGIISLKVKNKDKLNYFIVALAFVIIIDLLIVDLAPEVLELFEDLNLINRIINISIFVILGIVILKILDLFIPDHHHEHHDKNDNKIEHASHIKHIGLLTLISLVLHNILEGFALYGIATTNFKVGLLICVSVALHNIPLGTHIFNSLDIKKNKLWLTLLTLSSFIGGILCLLIGPISNYILGVITSITIGMLIYIALFELLEELIHNIKRKETKIGLVTGIIILIISLFL